MRASQRDHLFSFAEYAEGYNSYYLNIFTSSIPRYFSLIKFDLVVFSWSFLGNRFTHQTFRDSLKKIQLIKSYDCPKIALPQDEFSNTAALCDVINEFSIDIVYSVSPESEWKKMYHTVDFNKVKFYQVLTGYLDENLIRKISIMHANASSRPIDIGYRSGSAVYWGRFNLVKFTIAELFYEYALKRELKTDIAFGWNNFLMGDEWYDFLMQCKYMPGVEGGSSIHDWDGSLFDTVKKFLLANPKATFDLIESNCIPEGKDGELTVVALSPRHLEACLTKTCQILVEGAYNGILIPGRHYIELKKDFSNIETVMDHIVRDDLRDEIIQNAYIDIVLSGKYTYKSFVDFILDTALEKREVQPKTSASLHLLNKVLDKLSWKYVKIFSFLRDIRDFWRTKLNR
jgi:hypothetical protein